MIKKIFIMAGEASGDMHGGMLVNALKKLNDSICFYGVGGAKLEREGVELLYDYADFSSMGIIEPIFKIRFYKKALKDIQEFILAYNINTIILIDFPGFNLLLAEKLKEYNKKIIYYISPQIWAWHYSRIKKIRSCVDAMIVLYPFEEVIYRKEGIKAFFAGNPLVDIVSDKLAEAHDIVFDPARPCVGLLPGSRLSEIKRHIHAILDAAYLLKKKYDSSFLLPLLKGETGMYIEYMLEKSSHRGLNIHLVYDNTYKAIEKCDFVITSSGTATLECAIIGKPMVIIYKVDIMSELFARMFLNVKNIGLVNIVACRKICPELLQRDVNGKKIFNEVSRHLDNNDLINQMNRDMDNVRNRLGTIGAIKRIAKLVLSLINE